MVGATKGVNALLLRRISPSHTIVTRWSFAKVMAKQYSEGDWAGGISKR